MAFATSQQSRYESSCRRLMKSETDRGDYVSGYQSAEDGYRSEGGMVTDIETSFAAVMNKAREGVIFRINSPGAKCRVE